MRLVVTALTLATISLALGTGSSCQVACIEDSSGTKCSAKSLKRYDGPAPPPTALPYAPGSPLTIDVLYGDITVERSASQNVEVYFQPYAYAAYDAEASARQWLAQNLQTGAGQGNGGLLVTVGRNGGSNGLGANVTVRIPDQFSGALNIVNRGGGPLNHFNVKVQGVGSASALSVTNSSSLGSCWVQAAPTVRSTTVKCGAPISVFDVADNVSITNTDRSHDGPDPAITLRLAAVNNAQGGSVSASAGVIDATFPSAAGCAPSGQGAQKTVSCGSARYKLSAGTNPLGSRAAHEVRVQVQ